MIFQRCQKVLIWSKGLKCVVAVCVLCLFLMVPWVGLQSVNVAFPGNTHLLFAMTAALYCHQIWGEVLTCFRYICFVLLVIELCVIGLMLVHIC